MSRVTEQKLSDQCKWFMEHRHTITDPVKRTEFLETCVQNLIYLATYLIEDIQRLEHRERAENHICVPREVRLDDNLRADART